MDSFRQAVREAFHRERKKGVQFDAKAILGSIAFFVLLDILVSVLIPDRVMNVVFVIVVSLLLLGILLVAIGTVTKNQWGINLEPVNCPACGSPMPRVRQPKSLRERLWGGGTCEKCGCEMDKWGRRLSYEPVTGNRELTDFKK